MIVKIMIPGEPVPQGRPKFNSHTKTARDPKKSRDYKKLVGYYALKQKPEKLLEGALAVEINIFKKPPLRISTVKKNALQLKNETLRPLTKPDIDNYAKGPLDACKGIIWKDDGQVVDLVARKYYSSNPRIEMIIRTIDEQ